MEQQEHLRQEHSAISGVLWGQMEEVYGAFLASGSPTHPRGELRMKISNGTGLEFRRGLDHLSPKGHCNLYGPSVSQGVDSPAQRGGGDSIVNDQLAPVLLPTVSSHLGRASKEEEV